MLDFYLNNFFFFYCNINHLLFHVLFFYFIIKFLENTSKLILFNKKLFFYFKIPADTQIIPNSTPYEQDLITLNCLLEKSLHSKFYYYWNNFPNKIYYDHLVHIESFSKKRANLANYFFQKNNYAPSNLEILFLRKKEHILHDYFFFNNYNLNVSWYNFKGFTPLPKFVSSLENFL